MVKLKYLIFHKFLLNFMKVLETMSEDNSPASTRENLTAVESNDSCIFTQTNSEGALSEIASNKK